MMNPEWYLKDEKHRPVSTFVPKVLKNIRLETSDGVKDYVCLRLNFRSGEDKETTVPLSGIDHIDWFGIDHRCIVNSDYRNAKQYLANVIRAELISAQTETRHCLESMGIHSLSNTILFVAGDRVIARSPDEGILSSIELKNIPFRLDIAPELTRMEEFNGITELMSIAPEIGKVLVAHTISGILQAAFRKNRFKPCIVLVIVGESGMLKSSYVPHIVQLYNRNDEIRAVTRFNSTQRYIEDVLVDYSECTAVIDDLHTAESKSIKRINETTFEEIIRRVGDDTGRGRMEGKDQVRKSFRGNIVFIGEYTVGKQSTVPRELVVNITKKPDERILDKYQRQQPLLVSTFYYHFIQWYVEKYDDICSEIGTRLTVFREKNAGSETHGRLLEAQFNLQISYMFFLAYCRESGFISQDEAIIEYDSFGHQLVKLIQAQQTRFKPDKGKVEDVDYLKLIRKLYKNKRFRLADSEKTFDPVRHDGLIYDKYKCLCLRSESIEKVLSKNIPDFYMKDVVEFLLNKGALKHDRDKNTVKISTLPKNIGSRRFYAIWLNMLE